MGNRIIKESICTSETLAKLTWFEEAFFYRLLTQADDYGRVDARAAVLKGRMYPIADVTEKQIEEAVKKLRTVGLVQTYKVKGKPILQFVTWAQHQQIRAKKSKYPGPEEADDRQPDLTPKTGKLPTDEINGNQTILNDSICEVNPIQSNPIQSNTSGGVSARAREAPDPEPEILPAKENPSFDLVLETYQNEIGIPTSGALDGLTEALAEGIHQDVVVLAIKTAADNGKRTWAYVRGILRNLRGENITTMADYRSREAEFQATKEGKIRKGAVFGNYRDKGTSTYESPPPSDWHLPLIEEA